MTDAAPRRQVLRELGEQSDRDVGRPVRVSERTGQRDGEPAARGQGPVGFAGRADRGH
jgi:hypothetical protein